jgi:eukaryotic-like serine/threonine-protein kinase
VNSAEAQSLERVGPYRVIKAIGAGGSARIDLARVERAYGFERDVVLKRPLEHLRTSSAVATTLRREASLGGRLRHPNVVAVLDAGQHDGYDYLALEYVRGPSLRAATEAGPGEVRKLPLDAALSIVIGVAYGLHFAHELLGGDGLPLGLVHRDVSPGNVLLGFDGTVKLADFGIAKDTHIDTLSGSLRGTVTYMAPEQCRGHAFDRRADVFSLGVILHELITGRRLFWADNDVASLHRVLSGAIPDPRSIDPTIAPELAAIAMHALAHDPIARIDSAKQLADRLEAFSSRAGVLIGARMIERALGAPSSNDSARLTVTKLVSETAVTPVAGNRLGDRRAAAEPSLVELIQSVPEPDVAMPESAPSAPPAMHFVPAPAVVTSSKLDAPVPAGRRRGLAIAIVSSILIGATITVLALREPSAPFGPGVPPPVVEPPPNGSGNAAKPTAEPESNPGQPESGSAPTDPDSKPATEPTKPTSTKPTVPTTRSRPRTPIRTDAQTKPPDKGSAAAVSVGSGSNAGSAARPKKVEWTPGMLLPTDTGSQRGSNR